MTPLWFGFGLLLVGGGVVFQDGPFLIAGAFSLLMALVSALVRDWHKNRNASANLDCLNRHRVGYEDERRAA